MQLKILAVILMFFAVGCKQATVSYDRSVNRHFHTKKVGESARDLLTASRFTSLSIEVQYMPGYMPDTNALNNMVVFLEELIHKPNGIRYSLSPIDAAKDTVLTKEEIGHIEKMSRKTFADKSELSLYILYTNGYFDDKKMLGYAYKNTSVAIAAKNIAEHSDQWGRLSKTELETRVLLHEMGHLLGLTNLGSPMASKHADKAHGMHCENKHCLMYAKIETTDYPAYLLKKERPALDEDCRNDLLANGGKKDGYYYVSLNNILMVK